MVPVEFWAWVIPNIKKLNPDLIFIAEIYGAHRYHDYIFNGKFDYLYDKVGLYDTIRAIVEGTSDTDQITNVWKSQESISSFMLRFLENHDEQHITSKFVAQNPEKAIPGMVISAMMHTGPVMIYLVRKWENRPKGRMALVGTMAAPRISIIGVFLNIRNGLMMENLMEIRVEHYGYLILKITS
jgi:hypothetical protein